MKRSLLLLLALLASGCALLPHPQPPTPPGVFVTVVDGQQMAVPGLRCGLLVDSGDLVSCTYAGTLARFLVSPDVMGWGAQLTLSADGFGAISERVVLSANLGTRVLPAFTALPRLVSTGGAQFQLETGEPFVVKGITHFQLYQRFLVGEDITPYLDDVMRPDGTCGYRLFRVFGMAHNLFHLYPAEHADYYDKLPLFAQKLASHRCHYYFEFVAFADSLLMGEWSNTSVQLAHWDRLLTTLQPVTNVIVELVNELNAGNPAQGPVNWIDTDRFPAPTNGIMASHGSDGGSAGPVRPWWGYETGPHENDQPQWPRKMAHNPAEHSWDSHVPVYPNETTRAADRLRNPDFIFDGCAGASLLSAGCTFHWAGGRFSLLMSPEEKSLAMAALDGIESVPLHCQVRGQAQYQHRADWETTDAATTGERVYTNRDDPAGCMVRVRPCPAPNFNCGP